VAEETRLGHAIERAEPTEQRLDPGMKRLPWSLAREALALEDHDPEAGAQAGDRSSSSRRPRADDGDVGP